MVKWKHRVAIVVAVVTFMTTFCIVSLLTHRRPVENGSDYVKLKEKNDGLWLDDVIKVNKEQNNCESVIKRYNISQFNFVMALSYWEQLTMATRSLCGLVNFARGWHARTVTPFTLEAGLPSTVNFPTIEGMPIIHTEAKTKPFSMLYNIEQFNSKLLCEKYSLPPLVSFGEFMRLADRRIILLHLDYFSVPKKRYFKGKHYVNCQNVKQIYKNGVKLIGILNTEAKKLGLAPFVIHTACCIDHKIIINSPQDIAVGCGFANSKNLTVIFTVWRGFSDNPKKRFRLVVTSVLPIFSHPTPNKNIYPMSHGVLQNATAFMGRLSGSTRKGFVVVHLRTAKIAMMGKNNAKTRFCHCLNLTLSIVNSLKSTYFRFNFFVDYGLHGSHASEARLGRWASEECLSKNNIHPIHYDPSKYKGQYDQGYVALVEQTAMAYSKVLVLVGGGSFQDQLHTKFVLMGKGNKVYHVCHTLNPSIELVYEKGIQIKNNKK